MATMTPNSFDPLKRYVNVRLQQGVPIVDADMNELDDVRKFELRAFLKWYVGDGVPEGNDGFRIGPVNPVADNDFLIAVGAPGPPGGSTATDTGLRNVGRIVVDGLDVIITSDTRFTDQPLHEGKTGSAALAAKWGVPVVTKLTTPGVDGQVVVYIDMWERLVTADEAPELVRAGLGVESCARTKREWAVRVRATMPTPADTADYLAGHSYYQLATLTRHTSVAPVAQPDVVDRRERRLLVPPAHLLADTMALNGSLDTLGYRRGEGRPAISLRDAINSLLAGRVPATADLPVSPGPGLDVLRRAALVDAAGGLVVAWQAPRGVGNSNQIILARLDPGRPDLGFEVKAVAGGTSATDVRIEPTAVTLPDLGILIAYQTGAIGASGTDVVMKRAATFAAMAAGGTEVTIAATGGTSDDSPLAVVVGDQVLFLTYQASVSSPRWFYKRYKYIQDTFPDSLPVQLPSVSTTTRDLHAAAAGGMVWIAFGDGTNLQLLRLNPASSPATTDNTTTVNGIASGAGSVFAPYVVAISATEALVFYNDLANAPVGLRVVAFSGGVWGTPLVLPGTDSTETNAAAVRDDDGTVYLFSGRTITGASGEIVLRRRNPASAEWGTAQRVSPNVANELAPYAITVPGQGIWAFWISNRVGATGFDLYVKRIITAI